jgi:hypothetical protein
VETVCQQVPNVRKQHHVISIAPTAAWIVASHQVAEGEVLICLYFAAEVCFDLGKGSKKSFGCGSVSRPFCRRLQNITPIRYVRVAASCVRVVCSSRWPA